MKLKPSYLIAFVFSVLILLWFIYGTVRNETTAPATPAPTQQAAPSVVIKRLHAEQHENFINLHGRSEAAREVFIKAETAGLVVRTPIKAGSIVKRGTLICQQDIDARQAMVDQAKAVLRARELEYSAAQKLVDKGYRSSTQALTALAALDGAKASVKQTQIELGNVNMRAPFGGVFEQQVAEVGDYLAPGQPCGLLLELDPLSITGEATEKQIARLKLGQIAHITLATGEAVTGTITYIQSKANPATRTFKIKVTIANKDNALKAGVTANIKLSSGTTLAHLIPASVLTLDEAGNVGVRYLDGLNIVRFAQVETIDETAAGIWVTGLAARTDLIIRGQDYVAAGTEATPSYEGGSP